MTDDEFIDALPADYLEPGKTATVDVDGVPVTLATRVGRGTRSRACVRTRPRRSAGYR